MQVTDVTALLSKGPLQARIATTPQDVEAARRLRALCFLGSSNECDQDALDACCTHILVEHSQSATLVCTFRMLVLDATDIAQSYSAQYYELSQLEDFQGPVAELGRFCIHPQASNDPDVLRVAWGAMTRFVDAEGIELLFGCSSFQGIDAAPYLDSFAVLKDRHLAPKRWLPRVKAPNVFRYAAALKRRKPDLKAAMRAMPPLLRTYLLMGGWVSDHAVVDTQMNTLHVFTGVEIKSIPHARKKLLRAVAG